MATGLDFFTGFNIFQNGLLSALILFAYFWALTYMYMRGRHEKADEFSLSILLPPLIVAFFMFFLDFNPLITGIVVLIVYFLSFNHYTDVTKSDLAKHVLMVLIVFMVLAMVGDVVRVVLFIVLLAYISF